MSDPNGGYSNGLNLATAEDQQRAYHQILIDIEQSWNPQGWQHEIEAGERARAIIQIAVAVRDFRGQDQAIYMSTGFERTVYEKATSSTEYRDTCQTKLAQIQASRRRQLAKEEGEWKNQNPEQQHQGMQQQGFSLQQPQYSSPLSLSQPQFTQQQQEQYQQQQRQQQQQQQQQIQQQQQHQMQLQQQYNQQRLIQQQQVQQQAQQQQHLQQQQQQPPPQYQQQQQQPQQQIFQLSQQQQQERNQIINEYMNSFAQKMGSPMLNNINQNPSQDILDLATAWGMQPAQAYLRQQAIIFYRQRAIYQQQQQQMQLQTQGMNGGNGYLNQ